MPEYIRACIVLLALSGPSWLTLRGPVISLTDQHTVSRWCLLWLSVTATAFLVSNFWAYATIVGLVLLTRRLDPAAALATFCLLLVAVPAASIEVPGFGFINYFVAINHPQFLSLALLVPASLALLNSRRTPRLGATMADKLLLAYLLLIAVLQLREANLTSTLRGCYYLVIGALLPYYVGSRALRFVKDFKQVMLAFVVAAALLGVLAIFESLRHWNLYNAMTQTLGLTWGYSGYLARDGLLRASGSVGQALVLGYFMAVGIGFWLFLRSGLRTSLHSEAPLLMIAGGLLASLSRGPWVGAAVILLVFLCTGLRPLRKILQLLSVGAIFLGFLSLTESGRRALNLLPFVGQVDEFNITYRQQLLESAITVIKRNFWLGSVDYLKTPEMQSMVQGQGIIDIVNSYIGVALSHGAIGGSLFAGFFVVVLVQLWTAQKRLPVNDERRTLGRALLGTLFGIMVMISAVSSIVVIPIVYWLVAGMCVAYLEMLKRPTPATERTAP